MNITGVTIYYRTGGPVSVIEVDGARYDGAALDAAAVENLARWRPQLERCADWLADGAGNWRRLSPAQARARLLDKVAAYLALEAASTKAMERRALDALFGPAAVEAAVRAFQPAGA